MSQLRQLATSLANPLPIRLKQTAKEVLTAVIAIQVDMQTGHARRDFARVLLASDRYNSGIPR